MPDTLVFFPIIILNKNIISTNVLLQIRSTVYNAYELTVGKNEEMIINEFETILFLSFRRVLNVIYSFLGNSPASEF